MFGILVIPMVASGPMWNRMTMHARHAGYDLDPDPTDTAFFPVSADYPTTASRASPNIVRMECTSPECPRLWLLVQAQVCVTRLVLTTRRRKRQVPVALPLALIRHPPRKTLARPTLIAHGWDGRHRSHRLLEHKWTMDLRGHSGTWAGH